MPVTKFRTFEEARRALWCDRLDESYFARVAGLWAFSHRLHPRAFPPGVFKYRQLGDAQRERERWITENVRRLRQQRIANGECKPVTK